ncbi:MAG: hypothetical protein QW356_06405 [Candidatus Hadarchaeales archaeon]
MEEARERQLIQAYWTEEAGQKVYVRVYRLPSGLMQTEKEYAMPQPSGPPPAAKPVPVLPAASPKAIPQILQKQRPEIEQIAKKVEHMQKEQEREAQLLRKEYVELAPKVEQIGQKISEGKELTPQEKEILKRAEQYEYRRAYFEQRGFLPEYEPWQKELFPTPEELQKLQAYQRLQEVYEKAEVERIRKMSPLQKAWEAFKAPFLELAGRKADLPGWTTAVAMKAKEQELGEAERAKLTAIRGDPLAYYLGSAGSALVEAFAMLGAGKAVGTGARYLQTTKFAKAASVSGKVAGISLSGLAGYQLSQAYIEGGAPYLLATGARMGIGGVAFGLGFKSGYLPEEMRHAQPVTKASLDRVLEVSEGPTPGIIYGREETRLVVAYRQPTAQEVIKGIAKPAQAGKPWTPEARVLVGAHIEASAKGKWGAMTGIHQVKATPEAVSARKLLLYAKSTGGSTDVFAFESGIKSTPELSQTVLWAKIPGAKELPPTSYLRASGMVAVAGRGGKYGGSISRIITETLVFRPKSEVKITPISPSGAGSKVSLMPFQTAVQTLAPGETLVPTTVPASVKISVQTPKVAPPLAVTALPKAEAKPRTPKISLPSIQVPRARTETETKPKPTTIPLSIPRPKIGSLSLATVKPKTAALRSLSPAVKSSQMQRIEQKLSIQAQKLNLPRLSPLPVANVPVSSPLPAMGFPKLPKISLELEPKKSRGRSGGILRALKIFPIRKLQLSINPKRGRRRK